MSVLTRRSFITSAAVSSAACLVSGSRSLAADPADEPVAFFLVGDTHFFADAADTSRLDPRSAAVTTRLVDVLNRLPGSEIPAEAGGGRVRAPRGVVHAGDCIDTGDKSNTAMQATEWAAFAETFGLNGKDGRLQFPVYEVHGNHDSPRGEGLAVQRIMARNKTRPGLVHVSPNGLHYSWDWGPVHFVNLGIVVGGGDHVARRRRYSPLDSLAFLQQDLREHVGESGRPVVITHHIDMLRYAQPLPVEDQKAMGMEWDPADVAAYYAALRGYSIAAILYGHTHARKVYRWNGSSTPGESGFPSYNVDNSSHFHGQQQACFYFEISRDGVLAREYATQDAWQTGSWTRQSWSSPLVTIPV
jgi:predicted phosphodiesterase